MDERDDPDAAGARARYGLEGAPRGALIVGVTEDDRLAARAAIPREIDAAHVQARREGIHGDPVLVVERAAVVLLGEDRVVEREPTVVRARDRHAVVASHVERKGGR